MIERTSKQWSKCGQDSSDVTSDMMLKTLKKEPTYSKQSIHSKLTRLYIEELSKLPHATPDSVLVSKINNP